MTTLVLCVDRSDDIGRQTNVQLPVAGWEAVRSLVTDVGLADPEDSTVNCLLSGLRIARDLRDERESAIVAVVSGDRDSAIRADRSIADQLEELIDRYDPTAAIVVTDSAEDERVVPIVESRLQVDAVDRVVVRQARDIESTYYHLKQFLADEELRTTILVPLGVGLLLLPALLLWVSPTAALAGFAGLIGAALLYKGLGIDALVETVPDRIRNALYSGQVSIVTYVAAVGLALVGLFFGALAISEPVGDGSVLQPTVEFVHSAIPWLTAAAVTASTGRLLDALIGSDGVATPYLNLPVGIVAVGLVIRGFSGHFLGIGLPLGPITLSPIQRLAALLVAGLLISVLGVRTVLTLESHLDRDA